MKRVRRSKFKVTRGHRFAAMVEASYSTTWVEYVHWCLVRVTARARAFSTACFQNFKRKNKIKSWMSCLNSFISNLFFIERHSRCALCQRGMDWVTYFGIDIWFSKPICHFCENSFVRFLSAWVASYPFAVAKPERTVWLHDDRMFSQFSTKYRRVTDRQTDGQTSCDSKKL